MQIKPALLFLETILALMLAWCAVFVVPFRWTQKALGGATASASTDAPVPASGQVSRAFAVSRRIQRTAGRLPWNSTCLVRAIAGHILLRRRKLRGSIIRLGVKKNGATLEAHAWLLYGPHILLGGEEVKEFVPLSDLSD